MNTQPPAPNASYNITDTINGTPQTELGAIYERLQKLNNQYIGAVIQLEDKVRQILKTAPEKIKEEVNKNNELQPAPNDFISNMNEQLSFMDGHTFRLANILQHISRII